MFGVQVAPEHIKTAEELIPKLPAVVNGIIGRVNETLGNFDQRLARIEAALERIEDGQRRNDSDSEPTRPAGVGATQRALESGSLNGTGRGSD